MGNSSASYALSRYCILHRTSRVSGLLLFTYQAGDLVKIIVTVPTSPREIAQLLDKVVRTRVTLLT